MALRLITVEESRVVPEYEGTTCRGRLASTGGVGPATQSTARSSACSGSWCGRGAARVAVR